MVFRLPHCRITDVHRAHLMFGKQPRDLQLFWLRRLQMNKVGTFPSTYNWHSHRAQQIRESQNHRSWKGPLEIIQFKFLLKQVCCSRYPVDQAVITPPQIQPHTAKQCSNLWASSWVTSCTNRAKTKIGKLQSYVGYTLLLVTMMRQEFSSASQYLVKFHLFEWKPRNPKERAPLSMPSLGLQSQTHPQRENYHISDTKHPDGRTFGCFPFLPPEALRGHRRCPAAHLGAHLELYARCPRKKRLRWAQPTPEGGPRLPAGRGLRVGVAALALQRSGAAPCSVQ